MAAAPDAPTPAGIGSPLRRAMEADLPEPPSAALLSPRAPRWPVQRQGSFAGLENSLKAHIRTIPDFPKPGVQFKDITTLMLNPECFQAVIDSFKRRYERSEITHVVSCESRGFIFGAPVALALRCAFVPVRKHRKLPGPTIGVDYSSRFHRDRLEVHTGAIPEGARVLVIDDMVATGGTLSATCELVRRVGGVVVECGCVLEMPDFGGREVIEQTSVPLFTLIRFVEGEDEESGESAGQSAGAGGAEEAPELSLGAPASAE